MTYGTELPSDEHAVAPARGRELAELILAESGRSGLGAGSRLPTERQLAARLGVTRSGIRQALAALEADGLISREVGRGTFFLASAGSAISALAGSADGTADETLADAPLKIGGAAVTDFAPADVMTVRRMLEPQAMPLVVLWATARDFGEMDRCLAGGDHAASFEEFEAWDLALHRCIIGAAHSPLLAELYGQVVAARHGYTWGNLKRRSSSLHRREEYQADHHAIVAALRARDADAAVEAMRVHLHRVGEHLLGQTQ